jgi:hypothetical protein
LTFGSNQYNWVCFKPFSPPVLNPFISIRVRVYFLRSLQSTVITYFSRTVFWCSFTVVDDIWVSLFFSTLLWVLLLTKLRCTSHSSWCLVHYTSCTPLSSEWDFLTQMVLATFMEWPHYKKIVGNWWVTSVSKVNSSGTLKKWGAHLPSNERCRQLGYALHHTSSSYTTLFYLASFASDINCDIFICIGTCFSIFPRNSNFMQVRLS